MTTYDGPGIYQMTEADYFADPVPDGSLSHSGAKLILEAPAKYKHDLSAPPREATDSMKFGSAVHCAILNPDDVDELLVIADHDSWRSKAAQELKDEAVAAGKTPILARQWETAQIMAERVTDHPVAAALLDACTERERSLFWEADGITKRARVDFMGGRHANGRYLAGDYKTAKNASLRAFERSIGDYGYHTQAAWYTEGLITLCGEKDPAFFFIVQETDPPFLVSVIELSPEWLAIGADRCARSVHLYQDHTKSGVWPGYPDEVQRAIAPPWVTIEHDENRTKWGME